MKTPLVCAVCLLFIASLSPAQVLETPGGLGVGAAFEISVPVKSLADRAGTGYGGSARFEYVPYKNIGLVATVGYLSWGDKGDAAVTSTVKAIELLAGPKFGIGSGWYGGFELGVYQATEKFSISGVQSIERELTEAMMGVFLGYEFSGVDLGVKYYPFDEAYTNVMVSVGYWFGL